MLSTIEFSIYTCILEINSFVNKVSFRRILRVPNLEVNFRWIILISDKAKHRQPENTAFKKGATNVISRYISIVDKIWEQWKVMCLTKGKVFD